MHCGQLLCVLLLFKLPRLAVHRRVRVGMDVVGGGGGRGRTWQLRSLPECCLQHACRDEDETYSLFYLASTAASFAVVFSVILIIHRGTLMILTTLCVSTRMKLLLYYCLSASEQNLFNYHIPGQCAVGKVRF